jgi:hypothetical protein
MPVPGSTMGLGAEWLTTRPLRLRGVRRTAVAAADLLTDDAVAVLRRRAGATWSRRTPGRSETRVGRNRPGVRLL